jgi:hypothetical protein
MLSLLPFFAMLASTHKTNLSQLLFLLSWIGFFLHGFLKSGAKKARNRMRF